MVMWKEKSVLVVAALLAGCGQTEEPRSVEPPTEFVATCPDPGERDRLESGDTFRDLARAHAVAVSGWEVCHGAMGDLKKDR